MRFRIVALRARIGVRWVATLAFLLLAQSCGRESADTRARVGDECGENGCGLCGPAPDDGSGAARSFEAFLGEVQPTVVVLGPDDPLPDWFLGEAPRIDEDTDAGESGDTDAGESGDSDAGAAADTRFAAAPAATGGMLVDLVGGEYIRVTVWVNGRIVAYRLFPLAAEMLVNGQLTAAGQRVLMQAMEWGSSIVVRAGGSVARMGLMLRGLNITFLAILLIALLTPSVAWAIAPGVMRALEDRRDVCQKVGDALQNMVRPLSCKEGEGDSCESCMAALKPDGVNHNMLTACGNGLPGYEASVALAGRYQLAAVQACGSLKNGYAAYGLKPPPDFVPPTAPDVATVCPGPPKREK